MQPSSAPAKRKAMDSAEATTAPEAAYFTSTDPNGRPSSTWPDVDPAIATPQETIMVLLDKLRVTEAIGDYPGKLVVLTCLAQRASTATGRMGPWFTMRLKEYRIGLGIDPVPPMQPPPPPPPPCPAGERNGGVRHQLGA